MVEPNPAGQHDGDLGSLLAAMAADPPPVGTVQDEMPQPGSPLDAALAVFHAAAQASDPADDDQLRELHDQREDIYRSVINDNISGGDA